MISAQQQSETTLAELRSRADRGDLSALVEMTKFPPNDAMRVLREYIHIGRWGIQDKKIPGLTAEAGRCLAIIPGHAKVSADIIEKARQGSLDEYDRGHIRQPTVELSCLNK